MTKKQEEEIKKPDIWHLYQKKIKLFTIRISLYIVILIILGSFIFALSLYRSELIKLDNKNIKELETYTRVIKRETSNTRNNLNLAQKYSTRWKNSSQNQKNDQGVSSILIKDTIDKLATKYNIGKYDFKMSVPQKPENNKFSGKILEVFSSTCSISFSIPDDVRAIQFFDELQNTLTGYLIIEKLSINKQKNYEYQDLVNISKGTSFGVINISSNFKWHVMRRVR